MPTAFSCFSASASSRAYVLRVLAYMALTTVISVGMTLFMKWFLRVWADGGYPFATTMTCLTMFLQWFLSAAINRCSATKTKPLTGRAYWRLAVPIGLCTSLDFMCSNLALLYITVTFFTIVRAASHVWTLLFSVAFGHQRRSWSLTAVVLLISSGIALSSYGSTSFNITGFALVLAASIFGTLRWVLTQSLLAEMGDDVSNPVLTIVYHSLPASAWGLLPIAMAYDGKALVHSKFVTDSTLLMESLALAALCGLFAFALVMVKIHLVQQTSALTLGIAGSVRDTSQILLAVMLFGDSLALVNVVGLVVATCGMLLYAFVKHSQRDDADDTSEESGSDESTDDAPDKGKRSALVMTHDEVHSLSPAATPSKLDEIPYRMC